MVELGLRHAYQSARNSLQPFQSYTLKDGHSSRSIRLSLTA